MSTYPDEFKQLKEENENLKDLVGLALSYLENEEYDRAIAALKEAKGDK